MTAPYRWLRAAHKIAPNGACFHDISFYRLDRTERSRPFPTNLPEVRNVPIYFFDSLRDAAHGSVPFVLFAPHGANSTIFIISYLFSLSLAHQLQHLHRDVILLVPGAAGSGVGNGFGGAVGGVS